MHIRKVKGVNKLNGGRTYKVEECSIYVQLGSEDGGQMLGLKVGMRRKILPAEGIGK